MRLMMVPCCSSGITTRSSPSTGSLPETEPEHCRREVTGHRGHRGSPSTGSLPETEPEHCRRGGHRSQRSQRGHRPQAHCQRPNTAGGRSQVTEVTEGVTVHRLAARDRARTLPEGRSQVTEVTEGSPSTGSLPETEHCRREVTGHRGHRGGHRPPAHCQRPNTAGGEVTGHRGHREVIIHRLTARDRTLPEGRSQVTEVTEGSPSTGSLPETEHCRREVTGHRGHRGSPSTGSLPETEPEHCRRGGHRSQRSQRGHRPQAHCQRPNTAGGRSQVTEVTEGVTVHRLTARDRTLPEGRSQVTEVTERSSSTGSLPETEPEHCRRGGHRGHRGHRGGHRPQAHCQRPSPNTAGGEVTGHRGHRGGHRPQAHYQRPSPNTAGGRSQRSQVTERVTVHRLTTRDRARTLPEGRSQVTEVTEGPGVPRLEVSPERQSGERAGQVSGSDFTVSRSWVTGHCGGRSRVTDQGHQGSVADKRETWAAQINA